MSVVSRGLGVTYNHGKTSVVKLTVLLGRKSFGRNTGEVDWWEDNSWEWASLGVVGLSASSTLGWSELRIDLEESFFCVCFVRDGSNINSSERSRKKMI